MRRTVALVATLAITAALGLTGPLAEDRRPPADAD
jgi:hypothetical protein